MVTLGLSLAKNVNQEDILPPTKVLVDAAHSVGYFQPNIDVTNDLVYGISPAIRADSGVVYEPFSLATLRTYLDAIKGIDTKVAEDPFRYHGFATFHEK